MRDYYGSDHRTHALFPAHKGSEVDSDGVAVEQWNDAKHLVQDRGWGLHKP